MESMVKSTPPHASPQARAYPEHRPYVRRVRAVFDFDFAEVEDGLHVVHLVTSLGATALLDHLVHFVP